MTADEIGDRLADLLGRDGGPGAVDLDYTSHRGERSVRRVVPDARSLRVLHPSDPETRWHPAGVWVFDGYDLGKDAVRTFACEDVHSWTVAGG